jgi:hypothetical protein
MITTEELEERMRLEGGFIDDEPYHWAVANEPTPDPEVPAGLVELATIPGTLHRPVSATQTRWGIKVEIVGCSLDRVYGFIWHPEPDPELGRSTLCRGCFPR